MDNSRLQTKVLGGKQASQGMYTELTTGVATLLLTGPTVDLPARLAWSSHLEDKDELGGRVNA